jgi:hypothetical protein
MISGVMLLWRCSCWAESEKRSWWELMASDLVVSAGKEEGMGIAASALPERSKGREGIPAGRWGVKTLW